MQVQNMLSRFNPQGKSMFQKTQLSVFVKIHTVYNIMDILFKNALRNHELDEFK